MIECAAEIISNRGGSISLDPNMRKELRADPATSARVATMIAMSDLLLPSGDEIFVAAGLSPDEGEETATKHLFRLGVSEIAIKRGRHGSSSHEADGTLTRVPAFRVKETDPTGAGDCFGGAYVAARRLGMSTRQCLTYANAAGARNVTFRGPMEGIGTRQELDRFIQETELSL
jgi:fructokinase